MPGLPAGQGPGSVDSRCHVPVNPCTDFIPLLWNEVREWRLCVSSMHYSEGCRHGDRQARDMVHLRKVMEGPRGNQLEIAGPGRGPEANHEKPELIPRRKVVVSVPRSKSSKAMFQVEQPCRGSYHSFRVRSGPWSRKLQFPSRNSLRAPPGCAQPARSGPAEF